MFATVPPALRQDPSDERLFAGGRGRALLFCWLGWVFDFYDLILFAFVKVDVERELHLDVYGSIAWIDGATYAATAAGGFWFGRIADRVGRRRALTWSILVYSLGALLTGFVSGFWSLLLARCITGIGVGGEWGVGHAIVAEHFPDRMRARASGLMQAGAPVAMLLAAIVGNALAPVVGWRWVFVGSALPALMVCFARFALPGEDRAPGRTEGTWRELFGPELRPASTSLLLLLVVCMTGFWCTYAWLPITLRKDAGAEPAFLLWFQVAVSSMHLLADVAFGFVADRRGRRRSFVWFSLLLGGGMLALAAGFSSLREDLVLFTALLALVGLGTGTWSAFGVLFAANFPERVRATAAAGFYNLSRGVQWFTQPAIGALFAATGTAGGLYVGGAMALLAAWLVRYVPHTEAR